MDARSLSSIWCLLLSIVIVVPTSSVSLKQNYEDEKTEIQNSAIPTERLETQASTDPIESVYNELEITDNRSYRQTELEARTSVEPVETTETSTPYEFNDLTKRSDFLTTTESVNSNKTVIPLMSTQMYSSSESSTPTEITKADIVIPIVSTEKYSLELPELSQNNSVNVTNQANGEKSYDYIEETLNLNKAMESITPTIYWLRPTVTEKTILKSGVITKPAHMEVVGISEKPKISGPTDVSNLEKYKEIIMTLQPSKEEKYAWLKEIVHNMLEETRLMRETKDYVIQMNQRYKDLPVTEADNSLWTKYSRAVAETFELDFYRNYPYKTISQQWIARTVDDEEYNILYNTTLLHLQQKKGQAAIQLAAPVRRVADIYKAILDTPLGIVQSKCKPDMPHWLCFAEYVVHLADISDDCEHIWYHAQVHLTVLQNIRNTKGVSYPANEIVAELNSRLSEMDTNNDVNHLFIFIINTLGDLRNRLKDALLVQASLYGLIMDLQSQNKLDCLNIDDQW